MPPAPVRAYEVQHRCSAAQSGHLSDGGHKPHVIACAARWHAAHDGLDGTVAANLSAGHGTGRQGKPSRPAILVQDQVQQRDAGEYISGARVDRGIDAMT